ncbi:MAG TPA: YbaK/EbsC family protein [Gaiellaceae bacterium]|nr:YbaK/EbsC family protein [Gaiellaceae bacterium]
MVRAWPEPVRRVSSFLGDAGGEARIEEFPEGASTAAEAARAVGCEPGQIVKSLVFVCGGRPVVALVPGDRRADRAKVAAAVGAEEARVASPAEVVAATGFEAGGVAPFPLPKVEDVLIERRLLRHRVVWAGAGSPRHLLALAPAELARLARARPVDVVEDGGAYHSPATGKER